MKQYIIIDGEQINKNLHMKPMYLAKDITLVFEDKSGKLTEINCSKLINYYIDNNKDEKRQK